MTNMPDWMIIRTDYYGQEVITIHAQKYMEFYASKNPDAVPASDAGRAFMFLELMYGAEVTDNVKSASFTTEGAVHIEYKIAIPVYVVELRNENGKIIVTDEHPSIKDKRPNV